ncbi:unnamed protein product [Cladocopium goreaui]|uniref:Uncharacterized protein n=1 Tax=Cladocopium goreaui TaxID=2562237 RepID=A0A9P1CBI0_9DINO|nr:unnamed protein product [Cladocopium goreaui]
MSEVEKPRFVMSQDKFLSSCSGQRSSACLLTPRPSSRQNGFLQPLRFIWPSLTGLTLIKVEKQQRQHIILVDQGLCEGKSIAVLHLRSSTSHTCAELHA